MVKSVLNEIDVVVQNPASPFGDLKVTNLTQTLDLKFNYNVNSEQVNTEEVNGGTVTWNNNLAEINSGTNAAGKAVLTAKRLIHFKAGEGAVVRFDAIFPTGDANSEVVCGPGDETTGLFWTVKNGQFGIIWRRNSISNFVAQTDFNKDKLDSTGPSRIYLDYTKGNSYSIEYAYGLGVINYSIMNFETGFYVLAHQVIIANTVNSTQPFIDNSSGPICIASVNTGSTTNKTIKIATVGAFIEGDRSFLGPTFSQSNTKLGVTTTLTNILTIRNKDIYLTKKNRTEGMTTLISISVDGVKPALIELIRDTTLGGTPSFIDINTNASSMEYDTAGTTVTGGSVIFSSTASKSGSVLIDEKIFISPNETITIAVAATTSTTDVSASIVWIEED